MNTPDQPVLAARYQLDGQPVLRMGSREQPVLAKRGDDLRIDWGYLYLAADRAEGVTQAAIDRNQARARLRERRASCPTPDDLCDAPRQIRCWLTRIDLAVARPVSRYLMLAYDDLYSIEYFQRRERPWWRRKGAEAADLLRAARREHDALLRRGHGASTTS